MKSHPPRAIVYSDPFVPREWIEAHGLQPVRHRPRQTPARTNPAGGRRTRGRAEGLCEYARQFANESASLPNAAGLVITTVCDQMRRISEDLRQLAAAPVFLMHVPTTWQSEGAMQLYRSELIRLGRFLVGVGGLDLAGEGLKASMLRNDDLRATLRGAVGRRRGRPFAEALAFFHETGNLRTPDLKAQGTSGIPIGLVGGPLGEAHLEIFDWIEAGGGAVVLDGTETGERTLPDRFERAGLQADPLRELTRAYFGSIPDAFRRPNDLLYTWLRQCVDERGIRGLVVIRHLWCDLWHAEVGRLRECFDLPLLELDLGEEESRTRTRCRIEAFMEALQA